MLRLASLVNVQQACKHLVFVGFRGSHLTHCVLHPRHVSLNSAARLAGAEAAGRAAQAQPAAQAVEAVEPAADWDDGCGDGGGFGDDSGWDGGGGAHAFAGNRKAAFACEAGL